MAVENLAFMRLQKGRWSWINHGDNNFPNYPRGDYFISWMLLHLGNLSKESTPQREFLRERREKKIKSNKSNEEPKGNNLREKIKIPKYG